MFSPQTPPAPRLLQTNLFSAQDLEEVSLPCPVEQLPPSLPSSPRGTSLGGSICRRLTNACLKLSFRLHPVRAALYDSPTSAQGLSAALARQVMKLLVQQRGLLPAPPGASSGCTARRTAGFGIAAQFDIFSTSEQQTLPQSHLKACFRTILPTYRYLISKLSSNCHIGMCETTDATEGTVRH